MSGKYWDFQINPIAGCTKASEACQNCYAEALHNRFHGENGPAFYSKPFNEVTIRPEQDKKFDKVKAGQVVFVGNMCDIWHETIDFKFIGNIFESIKLLNDYFKAESQCCGTNAPTFLFLTKRAERLKSFITWYIDERDFDWPEKYSNVWIGVTAENQDRADERVEILNEIPAANRWISCEPLLGPIDFEGSMGGDEPDRYYDMLENIDLVIAGGESGPKARPCKQQWLSDIAKQCRESETWFYLKQWGDNYDDEAHDTRLFNPWEFSNPFKVV
jgi:protein gp37